MRWLTGLIEYLDVNEESVALIAMYEIQCHLMAKPIA